MDERSGLHRIEDDLTGDWVMDWANDGLAAIEEYLAKHVAFQTFLDD